MDKRRGPIATPTGAPHRSQFIEGLAGHATWADARPLPVRANEPDFIETGQVCRGQGVAVGEQRLCGSQVVGGLGDHDAAAAESRERCGHALMAHPGNAADGRGHRPSPMRGFVRLGSKGDDTVDEVIDDGSKATEPPDQE
ncbi:MAG: hypothetical protein ACRDT0_07430 [Pseudonocardiaceae bacterium]